MTEESLWGDGIEERKGYCIISGGKGNFRGAESLIRASLSRRNITHLAQ